MIRQMKNAEICWDEKRKATHVKQTTQGNKSENTDERRKAKKISRQDQTIQTKQDIPKCLMVSASSIVIFFFSKRSDSFFFWQFYSFRFIWQFITIIQFSALLLVSNNPSPDGRSFSYRADGSKS